MSHFNPIKFLIFQYFQAGITTFNLDTRPQSLQQLQQQEQQQQQRESIVSKSGVSILNENVHSDFTAFSERTSIIDVNGDNLECTEGNGSQSDRWKFLKSSKFKNIQIEMLYQRYLLRMNQNNAAHIVWLLFALIFILAIIHGNFFITRWTSQSALKCPTNQSNDEILIENTNSSENFNLTIDGGNFTAEENCEIEENSSYDFLGTNLIQFTLLGLCSILYTILLLCLYKQRINEIYLFHVSYAIIISLVIIDISFSITNQGR